MENTVTDQPASQPTCASCGQPLGEPFAHCGICRADYCLVCGSRHFCRPSCRENGCLAGLCVKLVIEGELSATWGVPQELVEEQDRPSGDAWPK